MTIQHEIKSDAPVALYRLFGAANDLLYVGITDSPRIRFAEHAKDKPWWPDVVRKTVTWCDDRKAACAAELAAIRDEGPAHNIAGKGETVHGKDRHRHPPLAYRPPVDVREALVARAAQTGLGLSAVITEALRQHFGECRTAASAES